MLLKTLNNIPQERAEGVNLHYVENIAYLLNGLKLLTNVTVLWLFGADHVCSRE